MEEVTVRRKLQVEIAHQVDGSGPFCMKVAGCVDGNELRVRGADVKVFHVAGRTDPLVWVWSACGEERTFFLPIVEDHGNWMRLIQEIEHCKWEPVRDHSAVILPAVRHPVFTLETKPIIAVPRGDHELKLTLPVLVWFEKQDHADPVVIARIHT